MKKTTIAKITLGLTVIFTISKLLNELEYKIAFDPKTKFKGGPDEETKKRIEEGVSYMKTFAHDELEIVNEHGDVLKATFFPSKEKSDKFMVLSHGYRNDGLHEFSLFFPFYYEQNVNLLIVDHQAHGKSEGNRITFGQREHVDLLQWMDYLISRYGKNIKIYLHGVSMGATTVLHTIPNIPENVKGVIADCGYANAKEQIVHTMKENHVPFAKTGYRLIHYKLKRRYDADLKEIDAKKVLKKSEVPIKIIHGDKDTFVPLDNAFEIYKSIKSDNKELVIVPGATHAASYLTDKELYERKIKEILEYK